MLEKIWVDQLLLDIQIWITSYSRSTVAGSALDEPAIAGDQGFWKKGPGRFVVSFGGRLYMIRIWMDRL